MKELGIDPGPIDGQFGPETGAAVRAFQTQHNLDPTGAVDAATLAALRTARFGGAVGKATGSSIQKALKSRLPLVGGIILLAVGGYYWYRNRNPRLAGYRR